MRDRADVQQAGAATPSVGEQVRTEVQRAIEQAREQAVQARVQAEQARQMARDAQATGAPPGTVFRVGPDGRIIQVEPGQTVTAPPPGEPTIVIDGTPVHINPQVPPEVVSISISFFAMIAFIIVGLPIARAFARRMDRRGAAPARPSVEEAARLQQIQTAVEAMAIEVERISENQRFVTRLIAEGSTAEAKVLARPLGEPREAR